MNDSTSRIHTIAIFGSNSIASAIIATTSRPESSYKIHHIPQIPSNPSLASITQLLSSLAPRPDVLISTANGGNAALQRLLISACIRAGIPRFMPAEFGFDSCNEVVRGRLPPYRARWDVIECLKRPGGGNDSCRDDDTKAVLAGRGNGGERTLQWAALGTGYPLASRLGHGHLGLDIKWLSGTVYGSGEERFAVSSEDFVGRAVVALITNWERYQGRYLRCCEAVSCVNGVVKALERAKDREWTIVKVESEKCSEEAEKRLQGGWPDAGMFLAERSLLCDERAWSGFWDDEEIVQELGVQSGDLDGILHGLLHEHKHQKGDCGCG